MYVYVCVLGVCSVRVCTFILMCVCGAGGPKGLKSYVCVCIQVLGVCVSVLVRLCGSRSVSFKSYIWLMVYISFKYGL